MKWLSFANGVIYNKNQKCLWGQGAHIGISVAIVSPKADLERKPDYNDEIAG